MLLLGCIHATASPAPVPQVQISEIMAAAHYVLADEDGDYSDWVELHNTGGTSINLLGWHLTDDEGDTAKWTFPDVKIPSDGYLVVFASGKNRTTSNGPLHTNFSLDQDGEYLALVRPDGTVEDRLAPFPAQIPDVSYDRLGNYLVHPTPGEVNRTDSIAIACAPVFSESRGFKTKAFVLTMRTTTPGAVIRYTLDGSAPTENRGEVYKKPIPISGTTVVRAIAVAAPQLPSPVATRTFLFPADIAKQSPDGRAPPGWPGRWGPEHVVDYGMDSDVVNARGVRQRLTDDLKSIPSLSLVMDLGDLFSSSRGIYANPQAKGDEWERPMSLEWIDAAGATGFQVNGGVRIRGGASRDLTDPKHSFHFVFRGNYGAAELEYPVFGPSGARRFDKFDLRCSQTNSWHFPLFLDPKTDFIRDQFSRDTQAAMGHPSTRGDFFHLYINGQYWGLYNTEEKPDPSFGVSYFGGSPEDYDWIKYDNDDGQTIASDGSFGAWTRLCEMAARGFTDNAAYQKIQGLNPDGFRNPAFERLLDLDNLIDYMIVGIYVGAGDNPHAGGGQNNWSGLRDRRGGFGFRFFVHDFEFAFADKFDDLLEDKPVDVAAIFRQPNSVNPWHLWQALRQNSEFRLRVADRLQKHFFTGGALTPEVCAERFKVRMREIDRAVVAESARWGDATPERKNRPFRRSDWLTVCNEYLLQDYLPVRSGIVLQQFREANLYPKIAAPVFSPVDAPVSKGESVTLTNPDNRGVIYFTVDGSDPRQIGGAPSISSHIYTAPVAFSKKTKVKVRVKDGDAWSALAEADFAVGLDYSGLRFTEIHYNPPVAEAVSGDDFEFVELQNGGNVALDLSGMSFTEGISFTFPNGSVLAPGAYLVLVRNPARFAEVHPGIQPAGTYNGRLDNTGEKLTVATPDGVPVISVSYSNSAPWPVAADGLGFSIVIEKGRNPNNGANWRASSRIGGSPGGPDPAPLPAANVVVNEVLSRPSSGAQKVELLNLGADPADISGWWLTNDLSQFRKFRIPQGTVLGPGEFIVFSGEQFSASPCASGALTFSPTGDRVWLVAADSAGTPTGYVHGFAFAGSRVDLSFGRWVNSDGLEQFPVSARMTFGGENAEPLSSVLTITEVQYRPAPGEAEWVELKNSSAAPIGIAGWKLDGLGFTFPADATVPAHGFALVVTGDPIAFRGKHLIADAVPIFGPVSGTLQDNGELVALLEPSDLDPLSFVTVDHVRYSNRAPWTVWGNADGNSLQRVVFAAYGDDSRAWLAGKPSPGADTGLNAAPRVRLLSPLPGTTFSGPADIAFRADANDPDGTIKRLVFLFDGREIGSATAPPWEFRWIGGRNGIHDLSVRAIDDSGVSTESQPVVIRIDEPSRCTGLGLRAEYYGGSDLNGTPIVRIDPTVDLHWSRRSPIQGIPAGPISIRWTGQFVARQTGEHVFVIRADGGVRFSIDGKEQIGDWTDAGLREFVVSPNLKAGTVHTLRLEYLDRDGEGYIALLLAEPSGADFAVIPQDILFTPEQNPTALGITTPGILPNAALGSVYWSELRSLFGNGALSWSWEALAGSLLPEGLTLHSDGVINGVPRAGGEYRFQAQVSDANGAVARRDFILRVDDRLLQAKPRIQLTSPGLGEKLEEGRATAAGYAGVSDGRQIAEVLMSVNDGPWRPLSDGGSWNVRLSDLDGLVPASNTIRVKARDDHGQESAIVTRRFDYVVYRPLMVDVEGNGTVATGFNGTSRREIGQTYTVKAIPAPGWAFAEWNGSLSSQNPTLTFSMEEGMNLTAVFQENPFPEYAGTYSGLLVGDNPGAYLTRGAATVSLTKQGTFTASIRVGTEIFRIKGKFDSFASYFTTLNSHEGTPYDIFLDIDTYSDQVQIAIETNWAGEHEVFDTVGALGRLVYDGARKPFPHAGRFTLVLPHGDTPAPQGDGFGLMKVNRNGQVRMIGELADGTSWSASAPITNLGLAPIYAPLYAAYGQLSGELKFAAGKASGDWMWLKRRRPDDRRFPDGFTAPISARASRYAVPTPGNRAVALSRAECVLTEGDLTESFSEIGSLSEGDIFTFPDLHVQQLDLRIDAATGRVSGAFRHPESGVSTPLRGVVEQENRSVRGFFFGGNTSGLLDVHVPQ